MPERAPWEIDDTGGPESPPWAVDDTQMAQDAGGGPQADPGASQAPFQALRGAQIEAQPSWWEKLKGFGAGVAKKTGQMGLDAAMLPAEVTSGALSMLTDRAPDAVKEADLARATQQADMKRRIEQALGLTLGENERARPGERAGRATAAALPQLAAGIATGGASIPAQMGVAGAVQGAQTLAEGGSPTEAALSAGGTGAMAGLGGLASKILAPGRSALNPEVQAAAQRLGVDLPASAQTKSAAVKYLEGAASKIPGGGRIGARADAAREALAQMGQDAASGAERNALTTGETVAQGYRRSKAAFDATRRALYSEAKVKGIPVTPQTTLDDIDRMLSEGTMKPSDLAFLRRLRNRIAPKETTTESAILDAQGNPMPAEVTTTPRDATRIWSEQRGLSESGWTNPNAVPMGSPALRRRLAGSLKGDLKAAVSEARPESLDAMQKADAFFAANAPKVNSQAANSVLRLARAGQQDKIATRLFSPSMSTQDIPRILEAAGPEATAGIRENVMGQLVKAATNGAGEFTPQGMGRIVKQWGPAKLRAILSPEQWQQVQDLATVSGSFADLNRIQRGSATGGLQQWKLPMAGAGYGLFEAGRGNFLPLAAAGGLTGLRSAGAWGLGTKLGQKWLTTGLPGAQGIGTGVGLAGRLPIAGFTSDYLDQQSLGDQVSEARRRYEMEQAAR